MRDRHPREAYCRRAQTDLRDRILEWLKTYDLTTVEELAILNYMLGGSINGTLKLCIRQERYGDVKTKNDLPPEDIFRNSDDGRHRRDG